MTARDWLVAHDRWQAWAGTVVGRAEGQLGRAALHRALGDGVVGTIARARASAPRQSFPLLAAQRFLGELDTVAGEYERALAQLQAALRLASPVAPHMSADCARSRWLAGSRERLGRRGAKRSFHNPTTCRKFVAITPLFFWLTGLGSGL